MAKFKHKGLIMLLFSILSASLSAQTNVTIVFKEGGEKHFSVYPEGVLYFENENLVVSEEGGNSVSTPLDDIQRVLFGGELQSAVSPTNTNGLSVAPSVVSSLFHIYGLKDKATVQVYSAQGVLMLEKEVNDGEAIDISSLASGVYFVCVNRITFKIQKL